MTGYQHLHHAGNCGDVVKHNVLVNTLELVAGKAVQPLHFIDTHAGDGSYNLDEAAAAGHLEWQHGIAWFLKQIKSGEKPGCLYARLVMEFNGKHNKIHTYPGSPWFAARLLGRNDALSFCELQKRSADSLEQLFRNDGRVNVYREDGFSACVQLLKRDHHNIVLIDPPYKSGQDEGRVIRLLRSLRTFSDLCTIIIWMPSAQSVVAQEQGVLVSSPDCSATMLVRHGLPVLAWAG